MCNHWSTFCVSAFVRLVKQGSRRAWEHFQSRRAPIRRKSPPPQTQNGEAGEGEGGSNIFIVREVCSVNDDVLFVFFKL